MSAHGSTTHNDRLPDADDRSVRAILVAVPPNHFGHRVFLGRRSKHVLHQGPVFKLPWLQVVETWSMDLGPDWKIEITVTTQDGLTVLLSGSLQWRPDPNIKVPFGQMEGHTLFPTMTEEVIKKGIEDQVSNIVGAIAGVCGSDVFIEGRAEMANLLNSVLRLQYPLHENHVPGHASCCGLSDCSFPEGNIPPDQQVAFYSAHQRRVRELLENESFTHREVARRLGHERASRSESGGNYSRTERTYGIDIVTLELGDVGFDAETRRARSEAQQAELRKKPLQDVLEGIEQLKAKGVGADNAADLATTVLLGPDNVPRETKSINIAGLSEAAAAIATALSRKT